MFQLSYLKHNFGLSFFSHIIFIGKYITNLKHITLNLIVFYFRDRKYAESKDLFTECGKIDDNELKKDIQAGVEDPLVDITSFEDKTLDEAYGTGIEKPPTVTGTVSQAMIKRFNQHSIMVDKILSLTSQTN